MSHVIREKGAILTSLHEIYGLVAQTEIRLREERDCEAVIADVRRCRTSVDRLLKKLVDGLAHGESHDRRPRSKAKKRGASALSGRR
jgi:DNA-binding FrmR family transcriptional regulator